MPVSFGWAAWNLQQRVLERACRLLQGRTRSIERLTACGQRAYLAVLGKVFQHASRFFGRYADGSCRVFRRAERSRLCHELLERARHVVLR